jgi:PAS domain S-box-containing protein
MHIGSSQDRLDKFANPLGSPSRQTLLLVVSDEAKATRLKDAFAPDGYDLETILSLEPPLPPLAGISPDLAILWFPYSSPEALPDLENLVSQLRDLGGSDPLPVLLIIDQYGAHWVEPAFRLGVTDILTRPIHPLVLRQRVRMLLKARETDHAIARYQNTQQALSAERQRLFSVLDLLPVYIFLREVDHSISFANQAFYRLFGSPGDQKCYQVLDGRTDICPDCPATRAILSQSQQKWEWERADGRIYSVFDYPFVERDGTTLALEIGVDITDVKKGELALRQEEERFRTIADFTYDWEYWSDKDGALIYNSPACERITGYPAQKFVDDPRALVQIVHSDDRKLVEDHLRLECQSGDAYSIDFRIRTAGGHERWIGHACQPVYGQNGQPLGRRISNRDITDRKQAEQQLVRSERLVAIGRLVASLAHEIYNPLQAMYSSIELAMDFPLEVEERKKYLQIVRSELEHLIKISDGILDFSRAPHADLKPTAIQTVIDHAMLLARSRIVAANVSVSFEIPEDLPLVMIAADQIAEVCLNIIINAVEHMPEGGSLRISAGYDGDQMTMSFADSGSGISPEELELIFDPFYSTKPDGTGLGLAVSQGIIRRHGGILSASSVQGKGAVFTIALPIFHPTEPSHRKPE